MSDDTPTIEAADFRDWLTNNHSTAKNVWVLLWKKSSGQQTLTIGDVIDQALCFGWIDSKGESVDAERYRVYCSPRKAGSGWSRVNKAKIKQLTAAGALQPAGVAAIERAKADGSWALLDGAESGIVPPDLAKALAKAKVTDRYNDLTPGQRKAILTWLVTAKRETTRDARITKTVASLSVGKPPL